MNPVTKHLLELTEQPYDNYNSILQEIKDLLETEKRIVLFERTLREELPLTTARRAYRTAIRISMGETVVNREWRHKSEKIIYKSEKIIDKSEKIIDKVS